ncbi:MAG: NAD(P)/FAD-dependent oxidoreductase [Acidobacteriota bacterium]
MSDTLRTDVAIIGAGPAGSTLAALLAMKGVRTLLIDRDRFPRDKLCGEFLSYDALPIVDLLGLSGAIDEASSPSISRCRIVAGPRPYEFSFPASARGISRSLLDHTLLLRARSLGAEIRDGWNAVGIDRSGEHPRIEISDGTASRTVEATVIAGAWGRWGRFDLQLGRSFVRADHRHFGFKRHYRRLSPESGDTITLYSYRQGYLGVSNVEGGLTNICGLVHQSRMAGMKGGWDQFVDELRNESAALRELFDSHEPAQANFLSSEPVIFRARSPVAGGIFMVGDAAGIMDPLTGNGMAMALQSALLAAPFIVRRLGPAPARTVEEDYIRLYMDLFESRLRWSRSAAWMLSRPAVVSTAMQMFRTPAIGRTFLKRTRARAGLIERMVRGWLTQV